MSKAVTDDGIEFLQMFKNCPGVNQTWKTDVDRHEELACTIMAREWCRRQQHAMAAWGRRHFDQSFSALCAEASSDYVEGEEFTVWADSLPPRSPSLARVHQIRVLYSSAGGAASSSAG